MYGFTLGVCIGRFEPSPHTRGLHRWFGLLIIFPEKLNQIIAITNPNWFSSVGSIMMETIDLKVEEELSRKRMELCKALEEFGGGG